ncbi:MAG: hypothetical protein HY751_06600 [Nitrospinae bacterium]|nr:hypothetical protein [Nitrospinota bacterium]
MGLSLLLTASIFLSGCKLQYASEDFNMAVTPEGAGKLTVYYQYIGTEETLNYLKGKDLDTLKDLANNPEHIKDASEKNVKLISRRLDFVDFSVHANVEAEAGDYKKLFDVFTNYKLEVADKIYITPLNGTVSKATLSDGGKIIIRNNKYTFAWPLETADISFKASYRVTGTRFILDFGGAPKKN